MKNLQTTLKEKVDELATLCSTLETRDEELQSKEQKEALLHEDVKSAQLRADKLEEACEERGERLE